MLMDYINGPQPQRRAPPEGVQVAGLLDFFELAARQGRKFLPDAVTEIMDYARKDPAGMYRENNLYVDPRGDITLNTGPTYQGRTIPKRDSIKQLANSSAQSVNLATYLNDTELGSLMRPEFDMVNVGRVPTGSNYVASFSPPTASERGVLAINADIPKDQIPQLFEHELQHAIQYAQGKPQGANPDMLDDEFMDYMISQRGLDPNIVARLDQQANLYGIPRGELRYYAARGEGEARAAEAVANEVYATGKQMKTPPPPRFYTTLPTHLPLTGFDQGLLYDIPQNAYSDFLTYRRSMMPPPLGSMK